MVVCAGTTGYSAMIDLRYLWVLQKRLQGSHGTNDDEARAYNQLVFEGAIDPCVGQLLAFEELPLLTMTWAKAATCSASDSCWSVLLGPGWASANLAPTAGVNPDAVAITLNGARGRALDYLGISPFVSILSAISLGVTRDPTVVREHLRPTRSHSACAGTVVVKHKVDVGSVLVERPRVHVGHGAAQPG